MKIAQRNTIVDTTNTITQKKIDNFNKNKNIKSYVKKYCNVHKTYSHDDTECRAQLKDKKNNSWDNKSKNYIMNEPRPQAKTIKIPITINNQTINAILDTGSDKNYLTSKITKSLSLNPTHMEREDIVEIADGTKIKINREIDFTFYIYDKENIKYSSKFHIIEA
ncbi:hypothetical protein DMUE_0009 [Dictyocoela muelleri]|nr:hypothetical protein DMUE_0009 [Dictyocoela muelleri]